MDNVFVFGSNLAGRHGKGAALEALRQHGAIYGIGVGRQGNSYAIPTKDCSLNTLPLSIIKHYVLGFTAYAIYHRESTLFHVTAIGTGLAGYHVKDIAPMFQHVRELENLILPPEFLTWMDENPREWGYA